MATPTITLQPASQVKILGSVLQLRCEWTTFPTSVQWFKNGVPIVNLAGGWVIVVGGGFNQGFTVATKGGVIGTDAAVYTCQINKTAPDTGFVTSNDAIVTIGDCIDARIDDNIMTALRTITVANGYNTEIGTVERVRKLLSINGRYPYTMVVQLETDDVDQWATLRDDSLVYIIWYLEGKDDAGDVANTEYTFRLRNVAADITKALKIDPSRGLLAQNTKIMRSGFGLLLDVNVCEPGVYVIVEIDRVIDPNNPYVLAP